MLSGHVLEPDVDQVHFIAGLGGDGCVVLGAAPFEVQLQVVAADLPRLADMEDLAVVDQHCSVAVLLDAGHLVGDQDDRLARGFRRVEDIGALLLEGGVADRQNLVDQQHVGVGLQHDREREAHLHP